MTLSRQPDWFLHAYTAATLDERLVILKQQPQQIILAAADGNESYRLLRNRYPQASFEEFDSRQDYLHFSLKARKENQNLWQKIRGHLPVQHNSDLLPASQQADMLWSNLGMIHQHDPIAIIENWASALHTDGLLFFSHFGPDSLQELRSLWQKHNIAVQTPMLLDMHDLGDLLLQHGFYDPVMDMSKLTLQYTDVERLIEDMTLAGLWGSLQFEHEADATRVIVQEWEKTPIHHITLELIYGHGVKKQLMPDNIAPIRFYPQRPADRT